MDPDLVIAGVRVPPELVDTMVSHVADGLDVLALAHTSRAWRAAVTRAAADCPAPVVPTPRCRFIHHLARRAHPQKPALLQALRARFAAMRSRDLLAVAPYLASVAIKGCVRHVRLDGRERFPRGWDLREFLCVLANLRRQPARDVDVLAVPDFRIRFVGDASDFSSVCDFVARLFVFFDFRAGAVVWHHGTGHVDMSRMWPTFTHMGDGLVAFCTEAGSLRGTVRYDTFDPHMGPATLVEGGVLIMVGRSMV